MKKHKLLLIGVLTLGLAFPANASIIGAYNNLNKTVNQSAYEETKGGRGVESTVESTVEPTVESTVEPTVESTVESKEVHQEKTITEKILEFWHKYRLKMLC